MPTASSMRPKSQPGRENQRIIAVRAPSEQGALQDVASTGLSRSSSSAVKPPWSRRSCIGRWSRAATASVTANGSYGSGKVAQTALEQLADPRRQVVDGAVLDLSLADEDQRAGSGGTAKSMP